MMTDGENSALQSRPMDLLRELLKLLETGDVEACRMGLGQLLGQLIHDLNNPLAALDLELFALDTMVEELRTASADAAQIPAWAETLADVTENLHVMRGRVRELLTPLGEESRRLRGM